MPRKNLRLLGGVPLMVWAARAALQARLPSRVVCSSEDHEILSVAREVGLETPFVRPAALALDDTLVVDVVAHALEWFRDSGELFEHVALLQATSPFVQPDDVDAAIVLARNTGADTVITGYEAGQRHPSTMFTVDKNDRVHWLIEDPRRMRRRQDLERIFIRSGMVYVVRAELVLDQRQLYGDQVVALEVSELRAVNIDSEADLAKAECLQKNSMIKVFGG